MKTTYVACLGLTLLLADACAGIRTAKAEFPPDREPTELSTSPNLANFGKFDGHGRLLFQELFQDGFPAGWHDTLTYYPRGSRKGVKLSRDVSAINVFLASEVHQSKTVRTFIKEYLTFFLRVNLGDDPVIISTREADGGLGGDPRTLDPYFQQPETRRLRDKIRPYACSPDPVIKGNGWTVDMNVLTDAGAVEHWRVKGRVSPLRIDSFLCEPKEPNGTFLPNVRTR